MEHRKGFFFLMLRECRRAFMFELATMIPRHQKCLSLGIVEASWPHYTTIVFNQDLGKWNTGKGLILLYCSWSVVMHLCLSWQQISLFRLMYYCEGSYGLGIRYRRAAGIGVDFSV